jgi:hypothetical protein
MRLMKLMLNHEGRPAALNRDWGNRPPAAAAAAERVTLEATSIRADTQPQQVLICSVSKYTACIVPQPQ